MQLSHHNSVICFFVLSAMIGCEQISPKQATNSPSRTDDVTDLRNKGFDKPTAGGNPVSVGDVEGDVNVAGRDIIHNPPAKRTSADLAITDVLRDRDGVSVIVTNQGNEKVEMLQGTITAQVIPEYVEQLEGTALDLIPASSTIMPNASVPFSSRCSDTSIWYVTGIRVSGEKNDDPNPRNSDYRFSRSNAFIIQGNGKGSQSWSVPELNRLRSN